MRRRHRWTWLLLACAPAAFAAPAWLTGDLHVHDDHSADGSAPRQGLDQGAPGNVSIADQILAARTLSALQFLPLTDHRTYDQHYDPLWESAELLLIPGEEANGSPHATVQGAVDSIVQGANPPGAPDFVNLQQSIWDAHAQDANWVTAHPDDGEMNDDDSPNARASAVGADLVEVWNRASDVERELRYAEGRWNAGFRFGVAGASDDHFREIWSVAGPGMPTTHVLADERSERGVVDGLRAGHTAVTAPQRGITLTLDADFDGDGVFEAVGGDEVVAPAGATGTLRVRAQNAGGNQLRVYRSPGMSEGPWQSFAPALVETQSEYRVDVVAGDAPAWYRVELRGVGTPAGFNTGDLPLSVIPDPQQVPDALLALTSPLFVGPRREGAHPELAIPRDHGRDDGAARVIGSHGRFSGFPDLAVSGGVAHLVAETHAAGTSRIEYRRRDADGTLAAASLISGEARSARFPKVAARGSDVWVAWQDERAGAQPHRPAIYLRHSADGGLSWEPEQRVRAIDGRCEHPALALDAGGAPVLAWQEISAGNPFDVMVQVLGRDPVPQNLSRTGKTLVAASATDSRAARYPASVWPSLAVSREGTIALAWQDDRSDPDPLWTGATGVGEGTDPDDWQIMVAMRAVGAGWSAPATVGDAARADRHPSLAYAADGTLALAWDSKELRASGANLAVLAALSTDGVSWSAPAPISAAPTAMSQYPRLGRDARGRVRAVWYDSRSADWRWRVMQATLVDGAWTAGRKLPSRGNNTWPVTAGGMVAFASTREARRLQRDPTQGIFLLP